MEEDIKELEADQLGEVFFFVGGRWFLTSGWDGWGDLGFERNQFGKLSFFLGEELEDFFGSNLVTKRKTCWIFINGCLIFLDS